MSTTFAAAAAGVPPSLDGPGGLEREIRAIGRAIDARYPSRLRHPKTAGEEALMERVGRSPDLRAALFRLVDVAPACRSPRDLAAHLGAFMAEVETAQRLPGVVHRLADRPLAGPASGAAAALGVRAMARRFIAGSSPADAARTLRRLWSDGVASSLDLLGETTVTRAEADDYAARCEATLRTLAEQAARWPARPLLERDGAGPLPRVNLSVKVTALTPLVRDEAPQLGRDDAGARLRGILRTAREVGAHVHVDMESMASRELIAELVETVLSAREFRDGPSVGIVHQAYLVDADEQLERLLDWAARVERAVPLTIRLVKGAYWDHEHVDARQHGWPSPVFAVKAESDRSFEHLTRRLLQARPLVRVAIASHNLRSIAHAIAVSRALGAPDEQLELQVLRGLGDDLQAALVDYGFRVRAYCPVGDLVAGMAYLVRRLLENTANDSFLASRAAGADLDDLLAAP